MAESGLRSVGSVPGGIQTAGAGNGTSDGASAPGPGAKRTRPKTLRSQSYLHFPEVDLRAWNAEDWYYLIA